MVELNRTSFGYPRRL